MSVGLAALLLPAFLLSGCSSTPGDGGGKDEVDPATYTDTDGDGLMDAEETALGTDPASADSDVDRLGDADEAGMGTDPLVGDTDGDTYLDGDEVAEGTDPTDPNSRIYIGYWPYYHDKDSISDPGFDEDIANGTGFPRFQWMDQFGDEVDIYDYAYQGKPILIDLSGIWCYYCNELAKWLEGRRSFFDDYSGTYAWVDELPQKIDNGDIYWVTILDADANGRRMDQEDLEYWYEEYPHEKVAVLADVEQQLMTPLDVYGYPTVLLLDETMTVEKYSSRDYTKALDYANSHY